MKIYFKSSRLAKLLNTDSVGVPISSRTRTSEFPTKDGEDSAVVLFMERTHQVVGSQRFDKLPSFAIYFNFSMPDGGRSRLRADQIYRRYGDEGIYKTYFGQGSTIPLDKIPEMYFTIKKIEMLIMNYFGVHSGGLSW